MAKSSEPYDRPKKGSKITEASKNQLIAKALDEAMNGNTTLLVFLLKTVVGLREGDGDPPADKPGFHIQGS